MYVHIGYKTRNSAMFITIQNIFRGHIRHNFSNHSYNMTTIVCTFSIEQYYIQMST